MRIVYRNHREAAAPMGGKEGESCAYLQALVDRCRRMEETQAKLKEQFHELQQEQEKEQQEQEEEGFADSTARFPSGFFFSKSPYQNVLNCVGHAIHVYRASSGEIIYWNRAAEKLYGWKDYEIIGQRVARFLVTEEYYASLQKILERLIRGEPWNGKFPFKKRSGQVFTALVTKTPLYEDGELVGVVTVSSDAAVIAKMDSENRRAQRRCANAQTGAQNNFKGIRWPRRPVISPVPQIASSVSNLASKFLLRRNTDNTFSENTTTDADEEKVEKLSIHEIKPQSRYHHGQRVTLTEVSETEDPIIESGQPSNIASRFLAKLQNRGSGKCRKDDGSIKRNCTANNSGSNRVNNENDSSEGSVPSQKDVANGEDKELNIHKFDSPFYLKKEDTKDSLLRLHCEFDPMRLESEIMIMEIEDEVEKQQGSQSQLSSSRDSTSSRGSSSSKGDNESSSIVKCEIRWEDLELRQEIGQGAYAVVYHGIWNLSDVAVKVFFSNGYTEESLQDYRKEIDIMKRLRHPNVLLFMGAAYSKERFAIVTELLLRGSLYKIIHNQSQPLDIKRRLRMALDVARGMNYLHCKNPPIVHRDLKSSNLLVDKNWTVKVGDFGLSKLKHATLLTTSGRGTPQWMAPEVLRNEPSNEKSDVFSYGVILWELMTRSTPWNNMNFLQVVGVVGFMDRRLDLPEGLDPHVASIIHDCWRSNPEERPSFEELIQRMVFLVNGVSIKRISES